MVLVSWNDLVGYDPQRVRALVSILGGSTIVDSLLRRETCLRVIDDRDHVLTKQRPESRRDNVEFEMNSANPKPFAQPFLVLGFQREDEGHVEWRIDVAGQIDLYLRDFTAIYEAYRSMDPQKRLATLPLSIQEVATFRSLATPLLESMIRKLEDLGIRVDQVSTYEGTAGSSHVLLNGALFQRVNLSNLDIVPRRRPHIFPDISQFLPVIMGE
jgi:hypothetical protein